MQKIALVTGGGTGIGRAIALEMARAGYDVAVHYNGSSTGAEEVQTEIESLGRRCCLIQGNLTKHEEILRMFSEVKAEFGRLDVFVSNAGVTKPARLEEMEEEDFDLMTALNFKGNYFGVQQAAQLMKQQGGSIIMISSNHAMMQHPRCSCYGALKAALHKLCKSAAMELGKYGIRVNVIAPGWTDTGAERLGSKEPTYYHIPLKRWCLPSEVGQAAVFLSSAAAASITGVTLVMDGGASLQTDTLDKYGYMEGEQ